MSGEYEFQDIPGETPETPADDKPPKTPIGDEPSYDDPDGSHEPADGEDGGEEGQEDEGVLETIEVEVGGKKYTVPKAVEDYLLRQEDYTQKSQDLAERRKEIEAYNTSLTERAAIQEAVMDDVAQIKGLEAQIAEYEKIDWPVYFVQNPQAAQYHKLQMEQLQGFHGKAMKSLQEKVQQVGELQSKAKAETIQNTITALEKPDPTYGWPGYTAARMDQLDKDAARIFGLTDQERSRITSPKSIKILHAAVAHVTALAKALNANKKPQQEAKPVKQIPSGRGRAGPSASGDELSMDKWLARERAAQARKNSGANGSQRT